MVASNRTQPSPTFPSYPAGAVAVTPSDSANLSFPSVVYVGAAGNVKVTTANGDAVLFNGVQSGTIIPVQVLRVWSTSTTATSIVAIY